MAFKISCSFATLILFSQACSHNNESKGEKSEVIETSTKDQQRPFWTYDGDWDIEKLRTEMGDSAKEPKKAFYVSSASVKRREAIEQCYQMASTRGSAEFAKRINTIVQDANAISEDQDETEFQRNLQQKTQAVLVGTETAKKTWAKIDDDGEEKYVCWAVMSMPRKNLEKLQKDVLKILEKEAKGDSELKARANQAVEKMASEF
jgi:hypothetical protein